MALPGLSGLEALRRLAGVGLQRPPMVLAVGARDDVRLKVIATHDLADAIQEVPCADGVLLRQLWRLVDREVEQHWLRLPPLPKALVRSTRSLFGLAGTAVTGGGELPADSARLAGQQLVEALCARLMGDVLGTLRSHHDYTFAHSLRVATHLATFALATGMRRDDAEILAQAGLLHDIGKAAVPVGILDKPGPLDSGEWHLVQRHPLIAADVLLRTPSLPAHLVRIAERHHERLDGSGYPQGLSGAQIDEPSLLCAIADVHTALTDRRAYRSPMGEEAAFARMRELAGAQLEPSLFRRYQSVMLESPPPSDADPRG
jgi:putative nucleotidyltransferase with HDIG domain